MVSNFVQSNWYDISLTIYINIYKYTCTYTHSNAYKYTHRNTWFLKYYLKNPEYNKWEYKFNSTSKYCENGEIKIIELKKRNHEQLVEERNSHQVYSQFIRIEFSS